MTRDFELFVALRYLRAKRRQAVVSIITLISIVGVAAGVMALIIALAINNGFRTTLQTNLLGASAHVSILEKVPSEGIGNWRELSEQLKQIPHVADASPSLYWQVLISGPGLSSGAIVKGIVPSAAAKQTEILRSLKEGSIDRLQDDDGMPGIILGAQLAKSTGMMLNSVATIIVPNGDMTPMGPRPAWYRFRVVGIFESGFFELDNNWAYTTLQNAQRILALPDVVNSVELTLDDIYAAPGVAQAAERIIGKDLGATTWMEQNKPILSALQMEKIVTVITIGMIQLVAALNILIALVMGVMEKGKDIAILMSMGATNAQIRRIFMLQGVLIGVVGSAIGLVLGYSLSYLADHYQWIHLDAEIYSLSFVPFQPRPLDALWVAGIAIFVSFVATIYPARNATRIVPVEALRYE